MLLGVMLAFPGPMRAGWFLFVGMVIGAALGVTVASAIAAEPTATLRNGVLKGWVVTRDDQALLCIDPMVFVRAKEIECP